MEFIYDYALQIKRCRLGQIAVNAVFFFSRYVQHKSTGILLGKYMKSTKKTVLKLLCQMSVNKFFYFGKHVQHKSTGIWLEILNFNFPSQIPVDLCCTCLPKKKNLLTDIGLRGTLLDSDRLRNVMSGRRAIVCVHTPCEIMIKTEQWRSAFSKCVLRLLCPKVCVFESRFGIYSRWGGVRFGIFVWVSFNR